MGCHSLPGRLRDPGIKSKSSVLAGRFFTIWPTGQVPRNIRPCLITHLSQEFPCSFPLGVVALTTTPGKSRCVGLPLLYKLSQCCPRNLKLCYYHFMVKPFPDPQIQYNVYRTFCLSFRWLITIWFNSPFYYNAKTDPLERTLILERIEGRRKRGRQRIGLLDGITDSMDKSLSGLRWLVIVSMGSQGVGHDWATELNSKTELNWMIL